MVQRNVDRLILRIGSFDGESIHVLSPNSLPLSDGFIPEPIEPSVEFLSDAVIASQSVGS